MSASHYLKDKFAPCQNANSNVRYPQSSKAGMQMQQHVNRITLSPSYDLHDTRYTFKEDILVALTSWCFDNMSLTAMKVSDTDCFGGFRSCVKDLKHFHVGCKHE